MARQITVNQVPIEWHEEGAGFTFFGIEAVLFWQNPSLLTILAPLREALGEPFYSALIAFEAAKGTSEDYYAMVETLGEDFPSGFMQWGRAVSGAGWGVFDLRSLDWERSEACVRIDRPWEPNLFWPAERRYAVPFLEGKLSGIFSWAFGTQCRASVTGLGRADDGWPWVMLHIAPSTRSLEDDLREVRARHGLSNEQLLQVSNRELSQHLDRFVQVVEATGEFIWEADRALCLRYVTDRVETATGYRPEELVGTDFRSLLLPSSRSAVEAWLAETDRGAGAASMEVEVRSREGGTRWLALGLTAMPDHAGAVIGYRGAARDITAGKHAEQELRLLATAFETSQAIVIVDADGRVHRANTGFERITGFGADAIVGEPADRLWPATVVGPAFASIRDQVLETGRWEGECSCRRSDGDTVPVWLAASRSPASREQCGYLVLAFHDLSEQKLLEERLEWEATHDHLTGLYNRAHLERLLAYETRRAGRYDRPLTLIMFDVDHFKSINDRAGHEVGDRVLRELAEQVRDNLRTSDVLARWGGEEFVILAPETDAVHARALAEKVRDLVAAIPFEDIDDGVTVSLGVAGVAAGADPDAAIHTVDQALYAAKAAGRNTVVVAGAG